MNELTHFDTLPVEDTVTLSKDGFIKLLALAKKQSDKLEICESFADNMGINKKYNCSLGIYKQIWKLKDDGIRPKFIIGNVLYDSKGNKHIVTKKLYYDSLKRRKELQEKGEIQ